MVRNDNANAGHRRRVRTGASDTRSKDGGPYLREVVLADLVHDRFPIRTLDLQERELHSVGAAEEAVGATPKKLVNGVLQETRVEVLPSRLVAELLDDRIFERGAILRGEKSVVGFLR